MVIAIASEHSPEECEELDLIRTTDSCMHPTFGRGNERCKHRLPKAIVWGLALFQAPSDIIHYDFSSGKAGQDGYSRFADSQVQ